MYWMSNHNSKEWDVLLTSLGGHPLQSALWGNAKRDIYGIIDQRFALYDQDKLLALMRVENRGLKSFLKIGWIPQGPTLAPGIEWKVIKNIFLDQLKKNGHSLCISSPWEPIKINEMPRLRKTIWINLQQEKEKLWAALDKQWRYGVRSAQRFGIHTTIATTNQDISEFYELCISISTNKKFQFQYKQSFLYYLLRHSDESGVEAKLFLIKMDNAIVAGAFILRIGKNCHYMFGAMNRKYSKYRLSEYVQWAVIEWACEKNCTRYDLEGIDEMKNPGVAAFKKKMGGEIIYLQDTEMTNFNLRGNILSKLIARKIA